MYTYCAAIRERPVPILAQTSVLERATFVFAQRWETIITWLPIVMISPFGISEKNTFATPLVFFPLIPKQTKIVRTVFGPRWASPDHLRANKLKNSIKRYTRRGYMNVTF